MYQLPNHVLCFQFAILGEPGVLYGEAKQQPRTRPVIPDEGTTTHHAAPLEGRLSDVAAKAVNELLLSDTTGNLSSLCSWANKVRFR